MKSKKHTDDFETTCEKIKFLLNDSISNNLKSDTTPSVMLSRRIRF